MVKLSLNCGLGIRFLLGIEISSLLLAVFLFRRKFSVIGYIGHRFRLGIEISSPFFCGLFCSFLFCGEKFSVIGYFEHRFHLGIEIRTLLLVFFFLCVSRDESRDDYGRCDLE